MKKLALLLSSLLVVGAVAQAKEVVASPAPVVEQTKEVVVAPVVIIEEAAPAFRPNGYADLSYRYYGKQEGQGEQFSRLQLQGNVNMTEKYSMEYRVRNYVSFEGGNIDSSNDYSDLRLRLNQKLGTLGSTKIKLTNRLEYRNYEGNGAFLDNAIIEGEDLPVYGFGKNSQYAQYQARFEFVDYFNWTPDWFKADSVIVGPRYRYSWDTNDSSYANTLGVDLLTYWNMPYGFSFEFNVYPYWTDLGNGNTKKDFSNNRVTDYWGTDIEAYIYWTHKLWSQDAWTLSANFEGGYDPYSFYSEKILKNAAKNATEAKSKYSLYALPSVQLDYQATEFVKLYGSIGAEYRNWNYEVTSEAQEWRWQPQVTAGFKVTF